MKRTLSFLVACFVCIGIASAASRTPNSASRGTTTTSQSRANVSRNNTTKNVVSRTTDTSGRNITARTSTTQRATVSRAAVQSETPRTTTQRTTTVSRAPTNVSRSTQPTTRSVTTPQEKKSSRVSRAATNSNTFGVGYNSCRDAYFTCMDQFCATADDTYRRCICSSRLSEIKKKQRALSDTTEQIQNFKDLNIEVIPKTADEVNAMLSASKGEFTATITKDTSDSAKKLAGISAVLSKTKTKSLSTAGTLDIAGDINAIWATTDLTSGVNIANLTGESLYNAVHSQCMNLVAEHCESKSTLNMVVSAYGMYIENDCTILSTALGKQKDNANMAIRETEREMNIARLDNYNAHNSTSINDCVAKVRSDITGDSACGKGYIHCLDISGLYLNKTTGEPIYTSDFYKLETLVSLSGDLLTNQTNRLLVAELNRKRAFANASLSTCQDLADEVWDEFMRQAITEIYQEQQSRIRQVKDECLEVVNKCYDQQTKSLRDFSNINEQLLLGSQLELSEQLCQEKLSACSNLYGGGADGLQELIATMYNITSQKIAQNCIESLKSYAADICAVPASDTLHSYPYACRVYAPGEQRYAMNWKCQNNYTTAQQIISSDSNASSDDSSITPNMDYYLYYHVYKCTNQIRYIECNAGYYLSDCGDDPRTWTGQTLPDDQIKPGNWCIECPYGYVCDGRTSCPALVKTVTTKEFKCDSESECCDYPGSLYQKIVRYAMQACMRPSETENITENKTPISDAVLQDVNTAMDSIRVAMSNTLQQECERLGGYWVTTQYISKESDDDPDTASNLTPHRRFYEETGANKKWGYCAEYDVAAEYYDKTINN